MSKQLKRTDFELPETLLERLALRHGQCAVTTSGPHTSIYSEAADRIAELKAQIKAVNVVIDFGETSGRIHDANGDFLVYTKDLKAALEEQS